jgi:hypothetical protein
MILLSMVAFATTAITAISFSHLAMSGNNTHCLEPLRSVVGKNCYS